jgi:predicted site-specific integrase-resolvase
VLEKGRLYKLTEVAAILGVEVGTVRRWVRAGLLPTKRIERLYFVYGGDLVPERTLC